MLLSSLGRAVSRGLAVSCRRPLSFTAPLDKGHSKWQNIKATKGKNDLLKSQAMNALLKKVNAATRSGGFDLKLNRELANLEQEFRAKGLPLDTFKNYLQKLKDKPEQLFQFHLIGPSGSFFIVETEAPSKSAMQNTLQKYMNKVGGFRIAADSNAVATWFDEKGVVRVEGRDKEGKDVPYDRAEEMGIEMDCEQVDAVEGEDGKRIYEMLCEPKRVTSVEEGLTKQGLVVESADVEMRPKHPIALSENDAKVVEKFYEFLQEDEHVRQIFDNIEPEA